MVLLLSLSFGRGGGVEYESLRCKTKQQQQKTQKAEEKKNNKSLLPPRIVEN